MKISHAALVATAIPLLLMSLPVSAGELPSNAKPHWSAAIGTGFAASANVTNPVVTGSSAGVTVSPHWTARIGTGTTGAVNAAPDTKQSVPSGTRPVVAAAHWTAKIGTGHAADSASRTIYASLTNAR